MIGAPIEARVPCRIVVGDRKHQVDTAARDTERLRDAEGWMRDQRAFWEAGFDRIEARLDLMADEEGARDGEPDDE